MNKTFQPTVYLLASSFNGTLYVGVTSHLLQRIAQHRCGDTKSFTSKYRVRRLVWFESHSTMEHAIRREKQIKKWRRAWKIELIEESNPKWCDLAEGFGFESLLSNGFPRSRE